MSKPVALVTGGSRGIGKGIALKLAENGFDIVINGRRGKSDVKNVIKEIEQYETTVLYVQADIANTRDRLELFEEINSTFERLDVLVNNAGVAPLERVDILDASEESYDRVMSINLKGPYFLTQLAAKWMIEQKQNNPNQNYTIINIGSISAYTSSPSRGEYCVSKAGMDMMTKLYADRLAEYDIPVFEVRPGITETDMTSGVKEKYDKLIGDGLLPIKRWGQPEDIGKTVAALAMRYIPYSTGQVINIDGGFHLKRL